jgi:hypothetical protein
VQSLKAYLVYTIQSLEANMAEQSISSLFSDVLGTPNTQAEQLAADRALGEKLQQGGSAALLFAPERARRLTQTIGGIAGADTRSPAEREAQATRKLVSGAMQQAAQQYPNSRAMQLKAVAQQLMSAGKSAEAAKFQDAAQAAELQEAKIQSEQAQTYQRNQAGNASREQAATTEATREGEVNKLAAQITKEGALTDKAVAETNLKESELTRFEAMTPLEIIKTNSEIAKNTAEYNIASERLTTIGKTDFDKLLENSDLNEKDKNKYRNMRIEALARTGSTQGFDIQGQAEEYAFGTYTDVINNGNEAQRPLEIFQSFIGAVEDGAATGPLADVERWSTSLGAMLNIDNAVAKAAANDLVAVLQGSITLAEAGALKGALSDKDLQFLQDSLPSYRQSEQGLKDVLAYLASSKAAEVYAGKQFAERMAKGDFSGKTAITSLNAKTALESVSKYNYLVRQRAVGKYKGRIPIPTASEIAQWAKFTDQSEGTAEALIEAIKLREEGA